MAIMPLIDLFVTGDRMAAQCRLAAARALAVPRAELRQWLRARDRPQDLGAGKRAARRRDLFGTARAGARRLGSGLAMLPSWPGACSSGVGFAVGAPHADRAAWACSLLAVVVVAAWRLRAAADARRRRSASTCLAGLWVFVCYVLAGFAPYSRGLVLTP